MEIGTPAVIAANLALVQQRIEAAALRADRASRQVTLVAVSKTQPFAAIAAAYEAGQRDFGENRVEELWPKVEEANRLGLDDIRWHLIGTIQSRKSADAIGPFALIHSVDRLKLVNRLNRAAEVAGKVLDVLLEVNVSGEESKHGFSPDEVLAAVPDLIALSAIRVRGLMTMAPFEAEAEATRPVFRQLRQLRERISLGTAGVVWPELSMGMTNDFEVAVEEGATLVRVGSAIFGGAANLIQKIAHRGQVMAEIRRVTFIGSGAMGEAMIKGMVAQEVVQAAQITASDPVAARREQMKSQFGVTTTDTNLRAVQEADVVILSVKPQILPRVLTELKGHLPPTALVLSIVAGVPIATMQTGLAHDRIVRTMPNTPAQVGKGMTVWVATPAVTPEQRQQTQLILNALGEQVMVEDEHYLDMATGLSGSGPGYVFLLIEAMIDAGVHIGFSRADAQKIVLQTIDGSVELVRSTGLHPAELKNRVTSPAGTTAAGLFELEQSGVRAAILRAVEAAYRRSEALGAQYSQKGDQ